MFPESFEKFTNQFQVPDDARKLSNLNKVWAT